MATLLETPPTRKAPKSFYCTLYDENGLLGKVDGVIYFFQPETGTITEYSPEMAPWTCILGEAGISDTQQIMDRLHGGYAAICTSRQNVEV